MFTFSMFKSQSDRKSTRRAQAHRRPLFESLEGRQLLTVFSVTNANDSGAGSLRQAIISSNASTGTATNTIDFAIGKSGVTETITPKSALPEITHPVVIDGTTEPGTVAIPLIVISGSSAGSGASGFSFNSQAAKSTLKGLAIVNFSADGVVLDGSNGVTVSGNLIGTTTGTTAAANGKGVVVTDAAVNNTLSYNTISGNSGDGVEIVKGSNSNVVQGNRIGTNSAGTAKLDNKGNGVFLSASNQNSIIGNTISQNNLDGVHLEAGADYNVVQGNHIGTDVAGTLDLGNLGDGVSIKDSADNTIGGTTAAARNLIAESELDGVDINSGSKHNVVQGNYIGTDVSGELNLGNDGIGVLVDSSSNNTIGGTAAGARNTISANGALGVKLANSAAGLGGGASDNVVQGNFIGTDATGTKPLGNRDNGLLIDYGSNNNLIGGTTSSARNVISDNGGDGVLLSTGAAGQSVSYNLVEGNFIGTDVTGTKVHYATEPLGNASFGVEIGGSSSNTIGGTTPSAANTIAGNLSGGVLITDTVITNVSIPSLTNLVEGNFIGTNSSGATALGNHGFGVSIDDGARGNIIGGTAATAGNTIADNLASGVDLNSVGKGNVIEYDVIDSNKGDGVDIVSSLNETTTVTYCTIESNAGWGILLTSSGTTSSLVTSTDTIKSNGSGTIHSS